MRQKGELNPAEEGHISGPKYCPKQEKIYRHFLEKLNQNKFLSRLNLLHCNNFDNIDCSFFEDLKDDFVKKINQVIESSPDEIQKQINSDRYETCWKNRARKFRSSTSSTTSTTTTTPSTTFIDLEPIKRDTGKTLGNFHGTT